MITNCSHSESETTNIERKKIEESLSLFFPYLFICFQFLVKYTIIVMSKASNSLSSKLSVGNIPLVSGSKIIDSKHTRNIQVYFLIIIPLLHKTLMTWSESFFIIISTIKSFYIHQHFVQRYLFVFGLHKFDYE